MNFLSFPLQQDVLTILGENPDQCITRLRRYLKDIRVRDHIFTYDHEFDVARVGYKCCYCTEVTCETYDKLFEHIEEVRRGFF